MTVYTSTEEAVRDVNAALNEIARLRLALEDIAFALDLDEARRTASAALNQQSPNDDKR